MNKKRLIIFLLTLVGLVLVFVSRNEISAILNAIAETKLRWLTAAILLQFIVYFCYLEAHRYGLSAVGIKRKTLELLPLLLSALVINSSAPSGGTSGTLIFINDAKKRGESGTKTGTGIMLVIITNFFALFCILLGVLIFLKSQNELGLTEIFSTAILFFFIVWNYLAIRVAKSNPKKIEKFFEGANDILYKFRKVFYKKAKLDNKWPKLITEELHNASKAAHNNLIPLSKTLLAFFMSHLFNILTIAVLFISFDVKLKLGVIISGYAIGELFKIISPSPEGIGVTEASMAIVYTTFGINPLVATSVALIYRGLNYWIPFGLGFIFLHKNTLAEIS